MNVIDPESKSGPSTRAGVPDASHGATTGVPAESEGSEGPSGLARESGANALDLRVPGREWEKIGLVEAVLARDRYGSMLDIGCATGELVRLLAPRCGSCTGMDADAEALAAARRLCGDAASVRFVPLTLPFSLPDGEHELVVLSDVLSLLDDESVERVAHELRAHAPCREIVVVGTRDGFSPEERDPALGRFVAALVERFAHEPLAVRRHYRIDALLR